MPAWWSARLLVTKSLERALKDCRSLFGEAEIDKTLAGTAVSQSSLEAGMRAS